MADSSNDKEAGAVERKVLEQGEWPEGWVPNAETLKAMEDAAAGRVIGPFATVEEMFEALEAE